jgi:hypothetical protein
MVIKKWDAIKEIMPHTIEKSFLYMTLEAKNIEASFITAT